MVFEWVHLLNKLQNLNRPESVQLTIMAEESVFRDTPVGRKGVGIDCKIITSYRSYGNVILGDGVATGASRVAKMDRPFLDNMLLMSSERYINKV